MSFLSDFDALSSQPQQQTALFNQWMATRSVELFAELRAQRPVLTLSRLTLVTRYTDVVDVLSRDADFGVAHYTQKMDRATGSFFLGMEDSAAYLREASIMRLACSRDDLTRIAGLTEKWSAESAATARPAGRIDIVGELTRRVPARLVADYFGVPGPDQPTLMRWLRAIFQDLFINVGDADPKVRDDALVAAKEMNAWFDAYIATVQADLAAGGMADTVLARCVRMQVDPSTRLDAVGIRRNVSGLILGTVETTSKATTYAIDFLLRDPTLLAQGAQLARNGSIDDLAAFIWEAMRLAPQAPALGRVALRAAVIARGTPHETTIAPGTFVLVATASAMRDGQELDQPDTFRPGRPRHHYLHFGHGLHECLGRYINWVQIPRIAREILQLPGLRRAAGAAGEMTFAGPFPDRLEVEFDAAKAGP